MSRPKGLKESTTNMFKWSTDKVRIKKGGGQEYDTTPLKEIVNPEEKKTQRIKTRRKQTHTCKNHTTPYLI